MSKIKVCLIVNRMIDIPNFITIFKSAPQYFDLKIVIPDFYAIDEYIWPIKRKSFDRTIPDDQLFYLKNICGIKNVIIANSIDQYKQIIKLFDVTVAEGLEYALVSANAYPSKNIALPGPAIAHPRLLKVADYYNKDNLRIFLPTNKFLNPDLEFKNYRSFIDGLSIPDIAKKNNKLFDICSTTHENYNILKSIGKEKIKESLGIKTDKKIAFISLRSADSCFTFYESHDEFVRKNIETLVKLKELDYHIISRRRVSKYDLNVVRKNHPENILFDKVFSKYIDQEFNGMQIYPSEVFCLPFVADKVVMSDYSGYSRVECAIVRKRCYQNFEKNQRYYKLINDNNFDPMAKELYEKNITTNNLDDFLINDMHEELDLFVKDWYKGNIQEFWKKTLDYFNS